LTETTTWQQFCSYHVVGLLGTEEEMIAKLKKRSLSWGNETTEDLLMRFRSSGFSPVGISAGWVGTLGTEVMM
jgi:hypothetical protein